MRTWYASRSRSEYTATVATPGSRHASVLIRSAGEGGCGATAAAAVAMADAVHDAAGVSALVKWPNDLMLAERKLVGILAEADGGALVLGAGCNVRRGSLPPELR